MDNLPVIDFKGTAVTPLKGKYRCPFKCHSHEHPAPVWKTENGFRQHMNTCKNAPGNAQQQAPQFAADEVEMANLSADSAKKLGLSLGDTVFYTGYRVTGPTHVMRGTRRVRVRYEELREYYAATARIESFSWLGALVVNGCIPESRICKNLAEAQEKAQAAQKEYQGHLDFAAAVR